MTASLLFCVGAMEVVGFLQIRLTGKHEILFTKLILDFVPAIILPTVIYLLNKYLEVIRNMYFV